MQNFSEESTIIISKDIYFNNLFVRKNKGYYIMGRKSLDSSMLIKADKIDNFKALLSLMDGNHTILQISQTGLVNNTELLKMVQLLNQKGMLEGSTYTSFFNEAEKLSISFFKYYFKDKLYNMRKASTNIVNTFYILYILVVIFSIICCIVNADKFKSMTLLNLISYKNTNFTGTLLGYGLITAFSFIVGIPHELAHALTSVKNGIKPDYFSIVLYLGFMPMCYVKQKNIYSLKKGKLYEVLFAGVLINFILALFFFDLYLLSGIEIFKIFALANFRMFYGNLIPLSLTDGYFIFSLVFSLPNSRYNFFKCLASPSKIRMYPTRYIVIFMFYFTTILLFLNSEIYIIFRILRVDFVSNIGVVVLINILYIFGLHIINKIKMRF